MSRKTFSAGVIATAATFVFTLVGAEEQGVAAQQAPTIGQASAPAFSQELAEQNADSFAALPRFVAHEVAGPLVDAAPAEPLAASLHELVAEIAPPADMSPDMQCLAQAVYFESRGEPLAGQLAVARVIINRTESQRFPDSYCSVVKQRAQFSFVRNGAIPAVKGSTPAWRRAKAIARIADEGLWESKAEDALYFHASHVKPRWASKKMARATIDSHIFYR